MDNINLVKGILNLDAENVLMAKLIKGHLHEIENFLNQHEINCDFGGGDLFLHDFEDELGKFYL